MPCSKFDVFETRELYSNLDYISICSLASHKMDLEGGGISGERGDITEQLRTRDLESLGQWGVPCLVDAIETRELLFNVMHFVLRASHVFYE